MLLNKAPYGCFFDYKNALISNNDKEFSMQDEISKASLQYGINKIKNEGFYTDYHDENYIKISLGLDQEKTQDLLKYVHILSITKKKN